MHRTQDKGVSYHGWQFFGDGITLWTVKKKAVLYKTKKGKFVDYEDLESKIVLDSIPLSSVRDLKDGGYMGIFVDSESIVPYDEVQHNKSNKASKKR